MTEIVNGIPQPVNVGEKNVKATWFETAGSGTTSGTVTKPAGAGADVVFIMDEWGVDTDALVSTMDGGRPTWKTPVDSGGNNITTTFNVAGEYSFSGTPSPAGDHAVIFVYTCYLKNFNSDESMFESELVPAQPGSDHDIADHADTTATGAELETLTDDSMADLLHRHSELSASDGTPNPALSVDADGNVGIGTAAPRTLFAVSIAGSSNPPALGSPDGATFSFLSNNLFGLIVGQADSGAVWMQAQRVDGTAVGYDLLLQPTTGAVGMGILVPKDGKKVTIKESTDRSAALSLVDTDNSEYCLIGMAKDTDDLLTGSANTQIVINQTFNNALSGILFGTKDIARLKIDSEGNIGFGELDPETQHEMTGVAPYYTLHNSTHEDTDGGRESRVIAKGEQTGGEETTLGYDEWSHHGAVDDEKGQKRTYINQGSDGDTPTLAHTIDSDLRTTVVKNTIEVELILESSSVTNITAAGGITVTKPTMHIQGSGGAVDITANPQIAAGTDGQLLILKGSSDTNTVQLDTGDGLHIHGTAILREHDMIMFEYDESHTEWDEITRNFHTSEKAFAFKSRDANTGTNYIGGYYKFGAAADDFNPSINFGTANAAYGAHFFLVQAAGASGGTDTVVRITGTTINDQGSRSAGATVDITVADDGAAGTYYETTEKWIGQIAIVKLSGPDLLCNYGFVKYWDNNNTDFIVTGFEATWLGAANDATPDIKLRHHKQSGWTYNVGAAPTPPSEVASMVTDYNTEIQIRNDEEGAWKRDNLNTAVSGSTVEGTMLELTTTSNKAYAQGNFMLRIRTN